MKSLVGARVLTACLLLAPPVALHGQNAVADWDAIAQNTVVTVGGKSPAAWTVFFA